MAFETNRVPVDWFTVAHFSVGLFFGQWFKPAEVGVGMSVFEITEAWQKDLVPQLSPHPGQDVLSNSAMDVAAAVVGAAVVRNSMRREGLLDDEGRKTGPPPPPFTATGAAVIAAKVALFGGLMYYGIRRNAQQTD